MALRIASWNVQGMRLPQKRSKILRHLRKYKIDVALLQETHLHEHEFKYLKKWWVGRVEGSPAVGRKVGVVTLLRKTLPYTVTTVDRDEEGRRLSITLQPEDATVTGSIKITNLYAPNSPNKEYFQELGDWYYKTHATRHVLGGDLNTTLCDLEDRSLMAWERQ